MADQTQYRPYKGGDAEFANVDVAGDFTVTGTSTLPGVEQVLRATVAYTDTTAKSLFTIPSGAVITGWVVSVTEAFNDTGTDLLDIGVAGTVAKFANDLDVSSQALVTSGIVSTQVGIVQATAQAVIGTYTGQNSDASAGLAVVVVRYFIP